MHNNATTVSSGESQSITTSETTTPTMLPTMIGVNDNRPWMRPRSLLARDTIWPVGSSSWRAKSRRCSRSKIALRRSYCTSSATRPPT